MASFPDSPTVPSSPSQIRCPHRRQQLYKLFQELKKYKRHSQIIEALRTLDYIAYIEEIGA